MTCRVLGKTPPGAYGHKTVVSHAGFHFLQLRFPCARAPRLGFVYIYTGLLSIPSRESTDPPIFLHGITATTDRTRPNHTLTLPDRLPTLLPLDPQK